MISVLSVAILNSWDRLLHVFRILNRAHLTGITRLSHRSTALPVCAISLVMGLCAYTAHAGASSANWPGWRGDGAGSSTTAAPLHWDAQNGVAWKTRLPGEGTSSPIVWQNRVFITAAAEAGQTRLVLCLDADTGDILWQTPIEGERTQTYPRSGHAAPTPTTDGQRVYAFFDSPGLVALDYDGNILWTKSLGPFNNMYNMAGSPVLCDDLVIIKCDHKGPSFVVAFERESGKQRWRTERKSGLHYATPFVFEHNGGKQIVVNAETIVSYDPLTGEALWSCGGMKHATTPSAIYHDGLVYATSGRNGPSKIIDPAGRGDISDSHVLMHLPTGGPYIPSPLVYKGLFVIPGDDGRITIVDKQGQTVLQHRIRSRFTASPVVIGDHIYWLDELARTYVLNASHLTAETPRVEQIAENQLEQEPSYASPAFASGRLFIRTAKHLYGIVGGDAKLPPPRRVDLPDDLDKLLAFYDAQKKGEFDDTMLRLNIVEKLAGMDDPRVVDVLEHMVEVDGHWDVTEAALRELGQHGERAVPALTRMFKKGQPFYKTVTVEHLKQIKSAQAVGALIDGARDRDRQVRIGSIKALGETAAAHSREGPRIAEVLSRLMDDEDGLIRHAAIQSLATFPKKVGPNRQAVIDKIKALRDDPNSLVAKAARAALRRSFHVR